MPGSRFLRRFPVDAIWNYIPRTTLNENTKFLSACTVANLNTHAGKHTHTHTQTQK